LGGSTRFLPKENKESYPQITNPCRVAFFGFGEPAKLPVVRMINKTSYRTITNIAISERHFVRTLIVIRGYDKNGISIYRSFDGT
jgi:hypothetical protein